MNVISFSLYGDLAKYCIGAIKNADLAKQYFADFICFFYYDESVPYYYIKELQSRTNVRLINAQHFSIPKRMWRFLAINEVDVDCIISRDVDSRLSEREASVVYDWLKNPQILLNIKDNPLFHKTPEILAGMWGMKNISNFEMFKEINKWLTEYNIENIENIELDQQFLSQVIYPRFNSSISYYDDFKICLKDNPMKISFKRLGFRFIGEVFDEFDKPEEHWKAIREFQLNKFGFIGKKIAVFLWKVNR